jgi:hypothetical protein
MSKQEKVNKFLRDIDFTQQTFHKDVEVNRAEETRRDTDNVKGPSIGLYHTDHAIKSFIDNVIEPYVEQDGEYVKVPVMYASPEKWASVQRDGFMKDDKGKTLAPIIVFNRTGMSRNSMIFNKISDSKEMQSLVQRKHTQFNRYDAFSILTNSKPVVEYFSVDTPDYVDITYNMIIWCDYTTQVNHLAEQILYWSHTAWGETFKFMVKTDGANFEVTNNVGEDRLVKATFDLTLQGRLLPKEARHKSTATKFYSPAKVVWNTEVVDDINNVPITSYGSGSLLEATPKVNCKLSFSDVTGVQLWVNATDGVNDGEPTNADPVYFLENLAGNGYDFEQSTLLNQPIYRDSGFGSNNMPCIEFDGINDSLHFPLQGRFTVPYTAFIVAQKTGIGGTVLSLSSIHWVTLGYGGDKMQLVFASGNSDISPIPSPAITDPHLFDWVQKVGIQTTSNWNGNFLMNLNPNPGKPNLGGPAAIGVRGGGAPCGMKLAEIIMYDRVLNEAEHDAVRDYLNAKYALY